MNGVIEKMRADLALLGAARVAAGEWSKEDERAIGAAIKAALDSGDSENVGNWSRWLAEMSARLLSESVTKIAPADPKQNCRDCHYFARPGLSDGGCSGRDDRARLYGKNHPLSVLPKDGGLSCVDFRRSAA